MKACENFEALLDAFVDGELSPEQMQGVQTHLNTCPACRAYVDDALAIRAAFPTVEETPVPEQFSQNVMAAIAAQSKPARKRKQPWARILLPVAACFAVVLALHTAQPPASQEEALPAAENPVPFSVTESQPAEEAPGPRMSAEPKAMPETASEDAVSPYFTHVILEADEASDLLAERTPCEETDTAICYELDEAAYHTLLAQLAERGITPREETPVGAAGSLALVSVLK